MRGLIALVVWAICGNSHYELGGNRISWYFSQLLRLEDNDLRSYDGFDFTEVLYICDKIYDELFEQSPEDIQRFKELLPSIKEYVAARHPLYENLC